MAQPATGRADRVFAVLIILFSALVYWQTLDLPPPRYEPMGSAALPRALSLIMAALAGVVLIRSLAASRAANSSPPPDTSSDVSYKRHPWLAVWMFIGTAIYVAVMDQKLIGYLPATLIYVVAACTLLSFGRRREIPWIALFAIVLSTTCYFVFTRIFYIDLP